MNKVRRSALMASVVAILSLVLVGSAFADVPVPIQTCGTLIRGVIVWRPCNF